MSKTTKKNQFEDKIEDYTSIYQKKIPFTLKFFLKDIEMSKEDFALLFLTFSSLLFLLFGQFALNEVQYTITGIDYFFWVYIFAGIFVGLILSIYIIDRIQKPLHFLYYSLVLSIVITGIQCFFILFAVYFIFILNVLFLFNSALTIIALLLYFKIFLIKTTILERGRVWAYFFVLIFGQVVLFVGVLIFVFLAVIPLIIIFSTVFLFQKNIKKNTIIIPKSSRVQRTKLYNFEMAKYFLFYTTFGFAAGFATSSVIFDEMVKKVLEGDMQLVLFVFLSGSIASILLGLIFDYIGRIGALSYIIFTIAIANYTKIFQFQIFYLSEILVFCAYIAGFMAVLLLVGDTATRENLGSAISVAYLLFGSGIFIGNVLKINVPNFIFNESFATVFIIGSTFMSCIMCYVLLVNIRETLPRKEQAWPTYLRHLYISHESGILLFEKPYKKEDLKLPPEIISRGIVGIKSILKEISRGEKPIRTIDRGDRALIIKTSSTSNVIFTLVVKEELIVLRRKLDSLIEEFDKKFFAKTKEISISGIEMEDFEELANIVKKHFGK